MIGKTISHYPPARLWRGLYSLFSFPNSVWERELEHFLNVCLNEFIIMPNHLHEIIIIVGAKHSIKECSKNLRHRQKNASPLRQILRDCDYNLAPFCHCEERSDVAISGKFYQMFET